MNPSALVERLRERAAALGLAPLGIAPVRRSDHAEALRLWLERGRHAGMRWMERTARDSVDLTRRFPWARTAVVVAAAYRPYAGERGAQEGLVPRVARYALGRDYHDTLGERLRNLEALLHREAPGVVTRLYVDTGPILERELAARAGLGWFGKSTNLILAGGHSWVLLGEILTSLDLPIDAPAPDRCGTCTACIDACPTAAIIEPYVVDSGRCLSYLTIEHRGRIPSDRQEAIGDWLFGCDVCQEVCPWNDHAPAADDPPFRPAAALRAGSLAGLTRLDEPEFRRRFDATALRRAGRAGLARNALIAGTNASDQETLDAAVDRVSDPDAGVRSAAARALVRGGERRHRSALLAARRTETDPLVLADIENALAGAPEEGGIAASPRRGGPSRGEAAREV